MTLKLYHNPRCSMSRKTLTLLRGHGVEPEIVEYMKEPPSSAELKGLVAKLGFDGPRELMRKKEAVYKELSLDAVQDEDALYQAMSENPKLIERPIAVQGERAALGRPPEDVLRIANYDYESDEGKEPWE